MVSIICPQKNYLNEVTVLRPHVTFLTTTKSIAAEKLHKYFIFLFR